VLEVGLSWEPSAGVGTVRSCRRVWQPTDRSERRQREPRSGSTV